MSEATSDERSAEKSCISVIEVKMEPDINVSLKKKRHVIKGNKIKPVGNCEKSNNSPLTKSLGLLDRLSKKGKTKNKTPTPLNESYEGIDCVEKPKGSNADSSIAVRVEQSPCSSSRDCITAPKTATLTNDSKLKKTGTKKRRPKKKETVKSHVLTEYYPVRRSSRKSKTVIEKEQTDSIIEAIKSKVEDGLAIKEFTEKGRGVIAKRSFKKGAFVVEYAGELIDWTEAKQREEKYSKDSSVGCYIVDATAESGRLGRLLNHSRKDPNCKTKLVPMPGIGGDKSRPRLIIIARRDIGAGEELTYDYGDRDKETLQSHPWLKST